jgi:hypothetical protein
VDISDSFFTTASSQALSDLFVQSICTVDFMVPENTYLNISNPHGGGVQLTYFFTSSVFNHKLVLYRIYSILKYVGIARISNSYSVKYILSMNYVRYLSSL